MNFQKWGGLGSLPFAPRVFSDVYSFTSTTFDSGKEASDRPHGSNRMPYVRGVVGWIEDHVLAVVSAGPDARYERFELVPDETGKTACVRVGWSRYLQPN